MEKLLIGEEGELYGIVSISRYGIYFVDSVLL